LADRFFGSLAGIRLFGRGKGIDSGLEAGEKSFRRKRRGVSPAKIFAGCLPSGGGASGSVPFRAGGKEVDEFGLASCVMCKGRKGGGNRA
jgi:hypothetical protein